MNRYRRVPIVTLAVVAVAAFAGSLVHSWGEDKLAPEGKAKGQADSAELATVKKTAAEFVKAFNAGDAKAVAALWTKDGEYVGPDGEPLRGRAAIAKNYAEFFKNNPKVSMETDIDSMRLHGHHTALEEGTLQVHLPGHKEPGTSGYSVLHVREDEGWRMASVREWLLDPQALVSLKDIAWLIGEWEAKSDKATMRIAYSWDADKAFLRARYTLKRDGQAASSGTQIIGKNPQGGLRSWVFDSSGSFGESVWTHDADRWLIEVAGTLPDGSEVTAVNILIPLGNDVFTWQSVQRTAAGVQLPDTSPLKVTRVKVEK